VHVVALIITAVLVIILLPTIINEKSCDIQDSSTILSTLVSVGCGSGLKGILFYVFGLIFIILVISLIIKYTNKKK
jgi:hypothetical protein